MSIAELWKLKLKRFNIFQISKAPQIKFCSTYMYLMNTPLTVLRRTIPLNERNCVERIDTLSMQYQLSLFCFRAQTRDWSLLVERALWIPIILAYCWLMQNSWSSHSLDSCVSSHECRCHNQDRSVFCILDKQHMGQECCLHQKPVS